jgi:Coenzyme F390 synthetase
MMQLDPREFRTKDERYSDQLKMLRAYIGHAQSKSELMRQRLSSFADVHESISQISDLEKLPVLRKSELISLQKNDPFGGLVPNDARLAHIFRSPGPINDVDGFDGDWWRFSRAMRACGIGSGDRIQNCFSYHFTPAG